MATNTSVNLDFKYGKEDSSLPMSGSTPDLTPGRVYIKKTKAGRAQMFIDTPEPQNSERLQLGGEIFVGDPSNKDTSDYDVIINPNGEVIENWVTTEAGGGFVVRVEEVVATDIDNWKPTSTPDKNMIIFVVES